MNSETAARAPAPPDGETVLADLYREHWLALVRLAVLLVGDREAAEDVVQDVFSRLHGKASGVLTLSYVRVSVLNASRSVLRRRGVAATKAASPGRANESVDSPETAALLGESRQEMLTALSRLPRRQREVLVLRYYLDLSDADIARATRIRQSTVRSTAARALDRLERELGGKA
ncbi:RNA polymerase sigma factor (sigma-70 family) [Nonomuraea thailandensis]|uniref:RNA polymerase sigma factor (Sigma-70 family) n=1 Tax=Nonomuraea thailandensis TaxID=1188745 RepID=A0A9X2G8I9_9ACTN|nr:sigma-70 family RNA polymerase sigma factor [Nonomuraea thailandensis]MCP2353015.1 RNA polymerase sigma factor (sigma-70 family) [Nonomuraea thailandensis]